MLGRQLGPAGILGVAVLFAKQDPAGGQPTVAMVCTALTEDMRTALHLACAPLIEAPPVPDEKKIIAPGGLN